MDSLSALAMAPMMEMYQSESVKPVHAGLAEPSLQLPQFPILPFLNIL